MPLITLPEPMEIDRYHIGAKVRGKFGRPPAQGKIVFGDKMQDHWDYFAISCPE